MNKEEVVTEAIAELVVSTMYYVSGTIFFLIASATLLGLFYL